MSAHNRKRTFLCLSAGLVGLIVLLLLLRSGVAILAATTPVGAIGSEIGAAVTKERLLALRPGMTESQILALVGPPIDQRPSSNESGPGGASHASEHLWIYARPSPLFGGGFEIYVRLKAGRLASVHVEEFDLGIYRCDEKQCPIWYGSDRALDRLGRYSRKR